MLDEELKLTKILWLGLGDEETMAMGRDDKGK